MIYINMIIYIIFILTKLFNEPFLHCEWGRVFLEEIVRGIKVPSLSTKIFVLMCNDASLYVDPNSARKMHLTI